MLLLLRLTITTTTTLLIIIKNNINNNNNNNNNKENDVDNNNTTNNNNLDFDKMDVKEIEGFISAKGVQVSNYRKPLLVFKALKGMAPLYLSSMLQPKPTSRYSLRSQNEHLLIISRTRCKTFGDRAFAVAGPKIWNSLPLHMRETDNVPNFKNKLKTPLTKLFIKNSNI